MSLYRRRLSTFVSQFWESKLGIVGLLILMIFMFTSIFANYLSNYPTKATQGNLRDRFSPPSPKYLLGTDDVGRDILTLIMYGGRISLLIGFLAAFFSGGIGTIIGLTAGYFGGWKEDILMRITDIVLVIPGLPLMLVLAAILGTSFWNIIFVISITGWTATARIVRAQVLSLKERAFIESSKAIGASDLRIIGVHLLPNVFPIILAQMVLGIGGAILSEASLSFLGLGDPLSISWGMILHWAFSSGALSSNYWWWIIPPGICITLVALGFTFVGYAFDQIVNPRIRRR
jgi:ABC-type dipeptide/oligopeptide/nickel transport system permease subunit